MRKLARVLAALICCAAASIAAAEDQAQRPCKADMEKYCADARGDRTKMGDCMRQHFNDFSAACQARIKERQQNPGEHGHGHSASPQATAPAPSAPIT